MAKVAAKARTMTPRDAVTELWQVLKSWESSLRQLCPGDASAVRDVRNNIQTAAGSRFAMESFGQTIADDILDVRGRLLGEQAQWKAFLERAEKNLTRGKAVARRHRSSSSSSSEGRERPRKSASQSSKRASPSNFDKPSSKRLYRYLRSALPKVSRTECYICAFLGKTQRSGHDFKTCRFFAEGLEAARAKSDYKDRG